MEDVCNKDRGSVVEFKDMIRTSASEGKKGDSSKSSHGKKGCQTPTPAPVLVKDGRGQTKQPPLDPCKRRRKEPDFS